MFDAVDFFLAVTFSHQEKDYILEQLSLLLCGNISIDHAFEIIATQLRTPALKKALFGAAKMVRDGRPLWQALEQSGLFPEQMISFIKLGEKSGNLIENLKTLIEQQRKSREFSGKITSALTYPILVVSMAGFIGIGIAWYILPRLAGVFDSLHIQLPWFTRILLSFGKLVAAYGTEMLIGFFVFLFLFFFFLFYFSKTKFIGESILFHLPGFGKFLTEMEIGRFGYVMSSSLKHGFNLPLILHLLVTTTRWKRYKIFYGEMLHTIESGMSFKDFFSQNPKYKKLLPVPLQEMIVVGEQSAGLQTAFQQIHDSVDSKSERTASTLIAIMEPLIMIVIWLMVLFIALSIIMPVYGIISGVERAQLTPTKSVVARRARLPNTVQNTPQSLPVAVVEPKKIEDELVESKSLVEEKSIAEVNPAVVVTEFDGPIITILPTETGYLNVRTGPSLASQVVTRLLPGKSYAILGRQSEWVHIRIDDATDGWVIQRYVSISE